MFSCDYSFSAFRLYSWRLSSSLVGSCALSASWSSCLLSSLSYPLWGLTIAYGSLDYVYKGTTTCNIVVRLCPLVSAYVRVLTFRRIILTVRLLHLASCSHYTWFILLNISYLCSRIMRATSDHIRKEIIIRN